MTVTTTELGQARLVVWDRQARRNAWTRETIEGIADASRPPAPTQSVRCVIVSGAGEHFSAGDDLFAALESDAAAWAATVAAFQRVTRAALAAPVPVVAAIDGVCIGGALEFAASCDLRIATDRARFGTPEVGIGLVATNAGTLLLPEVLGETAARELLLTGALRDVGWMREHGFLNEVVAPGEFADRIASGPARSTASRAPRWRAPRRCSSPATASCSTPRWRARSRPASSCSTARTRGPRCARSPSG